MNSFMIFAQPGPVDVFTPMLLIGLALLVSVCLLVCLLGLVFGFIKKPSSEKNPQPDELDKPTEHKLEKPDKSTKNAESSD